MTNLSNTQAIWEWLGGMDYPPPEVKKGDRFASGNCWLCGGDTNSKGWPIKKAFGPTFTDISSVAELEAKACCQPCVALSKSEAWVMYAQANPERGLASHFPKKEDKEPRMLNWLYMSHVITPKSHISPTWKEWRGLLCNPPPPPFVAVFAVTQKLQIMFRAQINESTGPYWLQADQQSVWIEPDRIGLLLDLFELGMKLGLNRGAMASGKYTSQHLRGVKIGEFEKLESKLKTYRLSNPDWMPICEKVAQKPEEIDKPIKQKPIPKPEKIGETLDLQF